MLNCEVSLVIKQVSHRVLKRVLYLFKVQLTIAVSNKYMLEKIVENLLGSYLGIERKVECLSLYHKLFD